MANTWIQNFKDALYATEQFLDEKKSGQYPPDVLALRTFISATLTNHLDDQIASQLSAIIMKPTNRGPMSKGLITKQNNRLIPGEFFRIPGNTITINVKGTNLSMGFFETLNMISNHGRITSNIAKSQTVNLYVVNTLAQMLAIFITQMGAMIGMERKDRDTIVSSTISESVSSPYRQTQTASAIKGLIADALSTPSISKIIDSQFGEGISGSVSGTVERFDMSSFGDIQTGLAKAIATQKIAPILDIASNVLSATAGGMCADDGVKSYDQE
jgi:hypothetical protein